MSTKDKEKGLKRLVLFIAAEAFAVALFVWFFDPFYQYHAPFVGEAVLNDRDNQMPGTVRNFEYDSVLMGSSVAENFDTGVIDSAYGCRTLKIIRASGSTADLLYYLEMAQESHDLRNVFWCLDNFALNASTEITLNGGDVPRYPHTKTALDDIPYIYNKEIILQRIPTMLAFSYLGRNTGGNAYNWSEGKEFGAVQAMRVYDRLSVTPEMILQNVDFTDEITDIVENLCRIKEQVAGHPQTRYRFLIPPYSMLWWDSACVNGQLEKQIYILERVFAELTGFENAELYFFQNEEDIVCDLGNYMDMVHYSPEINQYMLEQMITGNNRVTADSGEEALADMRRLAEAISQERIFYYYLSGG